MTSLLLHPRALYFWFSSPLGFLPSSLPLTSRGATPASPKGRQRLYALRRKKHWQHDYPDFTNQHLELSATDSWPVHEKISFAVSAIHRRSNTARSRFFDFSSVWSCVFSLEYYSLATSRAFILNDDGADATIGVCLTNPHYTSPRICDHHPRTLTVTRMTQIHTALSLPTSSSLLWPSSRLTSYLFRTIPNALHLGPNLTPSMTSLLRNTGVDLTSFVSLGFFLQSAPFDGSKTPEGTELPAYIMPGSRHF